MNAVAQKQLFTVKDYYKMAEVGILRPQDQVELIHGEIIKKMSPIRSLHASIVDKLVEEFNYLLRKKAIVRAQNPIHIDDYSEPEPDVVLAHYQPERYRNQHPAPSQLYLVVEVAGSSIQLERRVKLALYAEAGIPEYWIVNLKKEEVEVYRQPSGKTYLDKRVLGKGDILTAANIEFELPITDIFI